MSSKTDKQRPPGGFLHRSVGRFRRDEAATTAVEFAILVVPFFFFLLLVFEAAMVYLASQALENATQDSARLIRTGQTDGFSKESFAKNICSELWMFPSCERDLKVDVRVVPDFASADISVPIANGGLDDSNFGFDGGEGNEVVVIRAFYSWPVTPALPALIELMGLRPQMPQTGAYLLLSTAIFRNEPFT